LVVISFVKRNREKAKATRDLVLVQERSVFASAVILSIACLIAFKSVTRIVEARKPGIAPTAPG